MRGCLTASGLGLGIGGGLIYLFIVNETAWIIFLALGMFVLGVAVMAVAMLILNRQWTLAVFGGGQPPRINNNFRMSPYSSYPTLPGPQGYEPQPYSWPVIENQPSVLNDDSPMA